MTRTSLHVVEVVALLLGSWLVASGVPLGAQTSFGHSIKNGALPAGPSSEVTTFKHTCAKPPCVVTHVSVPSIYPTGGDPWNWTEGIVSFYVDGEEEPGIAVTLLELAGEGHWNLAATNQQSGNSMPDGSPWGIEMMGRTAKSGGVYSTLRIPFGKSIHVTIKPPPMAKHESTFWFVIRGLEAHAVRLGDLELPPAARLKLYRKPPIDVAKLQLITLAQVPKGVSGVLVRVHLDAKSTNFGFLEACMRFFPDGAPDDKPLFLSSGAEDYFLGASYFDEGMFKTPESGLTYFNRSTSTLAAYKSHVADSIVWSDGMRLVFRACEEVAGCGDMHHCPNQFCNGSQRDAARLSEVHLAPIEQSLGSEGGAAEYSTLVWTYEWPKEASMAGHDATRIALQCIQHLASQSALTEEEEDLATDLVLAGDTAVTRLLEAFALGDLIHDSNVTLSRMARQLRRQVAMRKSVYL